MRVELLNKAVNTSTHDVIRTFLLHDFPKCLLAEFNTHRMISKNWESSRARPVGSVIEQVMINPYIPSFTGKAKGMQGTVVSDDVGDRAKYRWLNARDNAVNAAQEMISLGIHKQDANRLLEPWMLVSGIVTGTEWGNFYKLRNHPHAQPAFADFASEMQRLDDITESAILKIGEWYKPWTQFNLAANTCKAASVSYANHAKDRSDDDYLRIHDDLINSTPIHASPLEHCAIAVKAGFFLEDIEMPFKVFDPLAPYDTVMANYLPWVSTLSLISTANFSGFLQYRKILEAGLKVDVDTGAIF